MTLGDARAEYLGTLDTAAERVAAQIGYLFSQVGDVDDYTGWTGLATAGSRAIEAAQSAAVDATAGYLGATLQAAGVADTAVNVAGVQVGRLGSGRDVAGLLATSQRVVAATVAGGSTFPEALASSQARVVGIAVSEPARIGRDGSLATGQADPRFGRFRRIAEPGACDFCRMLATRGAVYLTEESAGKHGRYHLWCRCHVDLVASAEAIAASKSLASQWRTAIQSDEAMQRAGAMVRQRLTAEDLRDLTDDELVAEMSRAMGEADPDFEWCELLDAEDQRRIREAAQEAEDAAREAAEMAEQLAHEKWLRTREGRKWLKAEREAQREIWDLETWSIYQDQMQACGGGGGVRTDLRLEAGRRGIDDYVLLTTNDPRIAYKYANEELLRFWESRGGRRPDWMALPDEVSDAAKARHRAAEDRARRLAEELVTSPYREDALKLRAKRRRKDLAWQRSRIGASR